LVSDGDEGGPWKDRRIDYVIVRCTHRGPRADLRAARHPRTAALHPVFGLASSVARVDNHVDQ